METNREIDILEMPVQGLAAYWLSLRKLIDTRKGKGLVGDEAGQTSEPFIRHLLEIVFSRLERPLVRRLAQAKRDTLLAEYQRKIDLMRLALFAIASKENPRVTLVRMDSKFATAPMAEKKAFDMAHGIMASLPVKGADLDVLLGVDHKQQSDRLMIKLLFYVIYARREGAQALEPYLDRVGSPYFAEGLSLAMDGFEPDFLAHHLMDIRDVTIQETARKMDMSTEMALAIEQKLPYDDVYAIARSYMP